MPRPTRGKTSAAIVKQAREFRRNPTPAEQKLWDALRGRKLAGLKFRRQHPYEQFVLDVFCVEHQLAVEADGGVHLTPDQTARDAARTEFLQARGIKVLRFTNQEIETNLPRVLKRIVEATASPPTSSPPTPSPEAELQERGPGGAA
jgi:very-short-patch-repair endonuclease